MTESSTRQLAEMFEGQRLRLTAVAFRVLGSHADAEDAVQEAWLRLARQDPAAIENVPGWLTTVVARLCIDKLRTSAARQEVTHDGEQLPELVVVAEPSPEEQAMQVDSVGTALLTVLDILAPAERTAFVLHDVFGMPFGEIGPIIDRSADAAKMLASRARSKVRVGTTTRQDQRARRVVVDAFLAAARDGDFRRLLEVLDPDVEWRTHSVRGLVTRRGATEVATRARRASHARAAAHPVIVNGQPGIAAWSEAGKPLGLMMCTVIDDRIVEIVSVTDPEGLANIDLPRPGGSSPIEQ